MTYPPDDYHQPAPPVVYGQPQPAYPPQQHIYQAPIVVAAPQLPTSGASTASLIFGIVGIVVGWCMLGVPCLVAIICGHIGLKQTKDGRMAGRGQAIAGLVMGYVAISPAIILFFWAVLGGAMGGVSPSSTPTP